MENIIGAIGILVAFALFRSYRRVKARLEAAQRWPTAQGRVIDASYRVLTRRKGPRFRLDMQFEYELGGRKYEGSDRDIAAASNRRSFMTEELAREAVAYWKSRNPLTVHYNPGEPADCLLELQEPSKANGILIGAFVMLLVGIAILAAKHWELLEPHVRPFLG